MNEYAKERILPKLSQNLQRIREIAHNSSDLLVNEFVLSGLPAALLCCEGMLSTSTITELILRPIVEIQLEHPTAEQIFQHIQKHQLFSTDRAEALNYRDLFRFLNSGFAVLVLDGCPKALVSGCKVTTNAAFPRPPVKIIFSGQKMDLWKLSAPICL